MTAGIAAALAFAARSRRGCASSCSSPMVSSATRTRSSPWCRRSSARPALFSFGVGSAPNRYLLEEMAALGRGARRRSSAPTRTRARRRRRSCAASPAPSSPTCASTGGGLAVSDLTPGGLPDLFAGQPLVVHGRYRSAGAATIVVDRAARRQGRCASRCRSTLPAAADRPAVATMWARARVDRAVAAPILRGETRDGPRTDREARAGARHRSPATPRSSRWIASRKTAGGAAETVAVPVEVPEGVRARRSVGGGGGSVGYGSVGVGRRACGWPRPRLVLTAGEVGRHGRYRAERLGEPAASPWSQADGPPRLRARLPADPRLHGRPSRRPARCRSPSTTTAASSASPSPARLPAGARLPRRSRRWPGRSRPADSRLAEHRSGGGPMNRRPPCRLALRRRRCRRRPARHGSRRAGAAHPARETAPAARASPCRSAPTARW